MRATIYLYLVVLLYWKKLLPLVARAVKLSQELPAMNTPAYIYYNDFPQYKAIAAGQSKKILTIVQNVLDILDAKSNVLDIPNSKNPREKFCSIVDANDKLLERLSIAMDLEEDPGRKSSTLPPEHLVVAVQKRLNTSLTWLETGSEFQSGSISSEAETSDGLLKLLTSTIIRRPQSLFSKPPDNSSALFRPNLSRKPNGILALSESIPNNLEEHEESPHPYRAELNGFTNILSNWEPVICPRLCPLLEGAYQFVDEPDALVHAIKEISSFKAIAVDLEHHNYRTYLGITCLIQLSTCDKDYILDALSLRDHLEKLNEVFTNPAIIKIFHGCDLDLMWLQRDFSVYVVNMFDTGVAARALQLERFSLSHLLLRYANVRTNKRYQLADWRIRPLPEELVRYARTDTHYLIQIAATMCRELQDRGLLYVVLERCQELCLRRYTKPVFNPLGYLNLFKQAASTTLSHRHLYALEQLYCLRDSIARREDESVHYVLPNHMLKVISEVLPRESSGLFACCNPIPPLVRKYVHDLHKIVLDARNRPLSELPIAVEPESPPLLQTDKTGDTCSTDSNVFTEPPYTPAFPPHDQSRVFETVTVPPEFPTVLKTVPSTLGRVLCSSPKFSNSSSYKKVWSSRSVGPDHMLLHKVLSLLSKLGKLNHPTSLLSFHDVHPNSDPFSQTLSQPVKDPAETIIMLDMNRQPNDALSPKVCVQTDLAGPQESINVPNSGPETAPADSSYDTEEVLILRTEMPTRSKGSRRRKRFRANADITEKADRCKP